MNQRRPMPPRNNNLKTRLKETEYEEIDRLFVYGTLQSGQSRNYILRGLSFEKALLSEHRKEVPPELGFPFIVQDKRSHVEGEVYFGLKQSHWSQIDLIEGEGSLYHRILVEVELIRKGRNLIVYTYYPSENLVESYSEK